MKTQEEDEICLRCKGQLQLLPESTVDIFFLECQSCGWHYTRSGQQIVDRWMSPISLVLYGIMFEVEPLKRAEAVANKFRDRNDLDLDFLLEDIEQELENPRQKVSNILNLQAGQTEPVVREYLKEFCTKLRQMRAKDKRGFRPWTILSRVSKLFKSQ